MLQGHEIRDARKRANMSQGELAKRVGVALRTVGGWERGETSPNIAEPRLLEVLGPFLPLKEDAQPKTSLVEKLSDMELLSELGRRLSRRVVSDAEWQRVQEAELEHKVLRDLENPPTAYGTRSPNPHPPGSLAHRRFEQDRRRALELLELSKNPDVAVAFRGRTLVDVTWTENGSTQLEFDEGDPDGWTERESRKTTDAPPVPEDAAAHDPGEPSQGDQRRGAQDSSYDIDQDRGQS